MTLHFKMTATPDGGTRLQAQPAKNERHTVETVPINAIWQRGDVTPAVITKRDGKYIEYVQLGTRDTRGAWVNDPAPSHAPMENDRGPNRRQDEAFRKAFAASLQHACNILNGEKP